MLDFSALPPLTMATFLGALGIFFLRILDVSIGTLRIGMLVRGRRGLASFLSFFESLIWLIAAAGVLASLSHPIQFVAYAGGYAAGTLLGATIEGWLAVGKVVVRIIAPVSAPDLLSPLREAGYYVTAVNASGRDGEVKLMYSVIPRKRVKRMIGLVEGIYPKAFVTIEEVTSAQLGEVRVRQEQMARRFRVTRRK